MKTEIEIKELIDIKTRLRDDFYKKYLDSNDKNESDSYYRIYRSYNSEIDALMEVLQ